MGHEASLISVDQALRMAPSLKLGYVSGILHAPRDGFVEPRSVAVAYAAGARDRGAIILTGTDVTGMDIAAGRVQRVHTSRGKITAEYVVLTTGAWTRRFGQQIGLNIMAVPVRHQAFVTVPIRDLAQNQPIVRITEPQIYVRPESGGLLVGEYGYRPLSFDMHEFPDDFLISSLPSDEMYYDQLTVAASQFFPSLRDAPIVQQRRGLPTIAPDG